MAEPRTRPIRDVPHYGAGLDAIRAELTAGPAAVFLDFDGTLAPIVARPADAVAPAATLDAMAALSLVAPVAVISGRDADDVARRIALDGVTIAGSHGFDVLHVDGQRERFGGGDLVDRLDEVEAELRRELVHDPGVEVERKRFAIAVHTRNAADDHARIAARVLAHRLADAADGLRAEDGKQIVEVRPDVDWDKGRVVEHLLNQFDALATGGARAAGPDSLRHVPVVVGDDTTDEDAFAVAARGRGVAVVVRGEDDDRPTCAEWSADDPADVRLLLLQLGGLLGA